MAGQERIFSSTGRDGVSRRPDARHYVNGTFGADYDVIERNFGRLTRIAERYPRTTRSVYRGLVPEDVARKIATGPLQTNLEVVLPVGQFTDDDGTHLVYLAQNGPDRKLITPREDMIFDTEGLRDIDVPPQERIQYILDEGFTLTDNIGVDQVDQVFDLWHHTFGWSRQEVENLRHRILVDQKLHSWERKLWFTAVEDKGQIVSLAMAERLSMPTANGHLDLVESTEWKTHDDYAGRKLMLATLARLNQHIISDLHDSPNGPPLIYAECSYQSQAHLAGHGVGFAIPDRNLEISAPQILEQNVTIQDGLTFGDSALRDFSFMYLPLSLINGWYNPNNEH